MRGRLLVGTLTLLLTSSLPACSSHRSPIGAPATSTPNTFKVDEATIASIQEAIVRKDLTVTELVRLYLQRIKAYNGPSVEMPEGILGPIKPIANSHQLNALATLNLRPATRRAWGFDDRRARSLTDPLDNAPNMPDALEAAAELDATFAKTGKLVGPLHGVVLGIKDQYDTFDMRTTAGADIDYANDRPPADAEIVRRLRAAGAIILAKANMGEYAIGVPRSSFGGVSTNAYDSERTPMASSSGAGTAVTANLLTCAIAEETGASIRGPAAFNSCVGISGTEELVSRHGLIAADATSRGGPICRTVEDSARILTVISGFDPKDEQTAFAVGRLPGKPYETFAHDKSLKGMRIGVLREYMDKSKFSKTDEENIDIINRAIGELRQLGAEIIEPGPEGLLTPYLRRNPLLFSAAVASLDREKFPVDGAGKATTDQINLLVAMSVDPSTVPADLTIRSLSSIGAIAKGESRYMLERYLRQRGDANIRSVADLLAKARFFSDPRMAGPRENLEEWNNDKVVDLAERTQRRHAVQTVVMQCMAELKLDAIVSPTNNIPAPKLVGAKEPRVNGRTVVWSFLGAQGLPVMTVPAGFTTVVYDREDGPSKKLLPPVPKKLPVGLDIMARPFDEPVMLRIASAYEAATRHRAPPPQFGPLPTH